MVFEFEKIIRAGDTDHTGYIYTPAVVEWIVIGVQEFRRATGYSFAKYEELGVHGVAVNVDVDYLSPITIGDVVSIQMKPTLGRKSVTFDANGEVDGRPVFEGSLVLVFVDSETRESVPIPDGIRSAFESYT